MCSCISAVAGLTLRQLNLRLNPQVFDIFFYKMLKIYGWGLCKLENYCCFYYSVAVIARKKYNQMKLFPNLLARGQFKYWERYVERVMQKDYFSQKWHPVAGWKEQKKTDWFYTEHKPWTDDFLKENKERKHRPRIFLEPIKEWKIFKGDRVSWEDISEKVD